MIQACWLAVLSWWYKPAVWLLSGVDTSLLIGRNELMIRACWLAVMSCWYKPFDWLWSGDDTSLLIGCNELMIRLCWLAVNWLFMSRQTFLPLWNNIVNYLHVFPVAFACNNSIFKQWMWITVCEFSSMNLL